jgi:hypothetical protein
MESKKRSHKDEENQRHNDFHLLGGRGHHEDEKL